MDINLTNVAPKDIADSHYANTSNPHGVTAAQVGSYTTGQADTLLTAKQDVLVSGTNIKTVNGGTLLGSGNVQVQATLVSGTNIKTINSTSLLGSGDVAVQATLVSGTNIKTINGTSLLGSGNLTVGGGITIGSTAITSGTSTRVLFEGSGNVVSEDAAFVFNATNRWLTNYGKGNVSSNTSFGDSAMANGTVTGTNNVTLGRQAGYQITSGSNNTFVGDRAGGAVLASNITGSGNTCLGSAAGLYLSSGIQNTFVGSNSGTSVTTGSYNTIIGFNGTSYAGGLAQHIIITDGAAVQGFKKDGNHNIVLSQESALATNATNGFLYVRACAGTPTGTPGTSFTGHVPIVVDSTNNKMYIYSGGAWVALN